MLDRTLGESLQVSTQIGPDVWPVLADPGQLESALLNLLLNARDAMKRGGRITIAARNVSEADIGKKDDTKLHERDFVALSVTDTGTGMSDEILQKAIDPFFTTKGVGEGSGLGLSMVYGFVMQSAGHLKIDSEPENGTKITMFLPRSREPEAAEVDDPTGTPVEQGGKTILIIEDDPDVCALASRSVTGLGYRTLTAPDVASARSFILKDGAVDLVLSDVVLPGGESGLDFAKELKLTCPGLPVIFMSGYPRDELELGELDGPETVLLAKPFRRNALAVAVRAKLEKTRSN
jgi:CheY-like chemotaxis protein